MAKSIMATLTVESGEPDEPDGEEVAGVKGIVEDTGELEEEVVMGMLISLDVAEQVDAGGLDGRIAPRRWSATTNLRERPGPDCRSAAISGDGALR
jgi:hypothetical protein